MRSRIFTRTVGYWPLQESSGKALDYSGNENHASVSGGVTYGVSGPVGSSSMSFDGSTGAIDTDTNPVLIGEGGKVSHFAWVKESSRKSRHEINNHAGRWLNLQDGYVSAYIDGVTGSYLKSPSRISLDKWTNVGWTWNGDVLRLYVDGEEVASSSYSGSYSRSTAGNTLAIGVNPVDGSYNFDGKIAHVRVWDYPLPEASIRALYNASRGGFSESNNKTL